MRKVLLSGLMLFFLSSTSYSSTMTYKFLIPDFGGDPDYWYGFFNEAEKQNIYHPPTKREEQKESELEDFKNRLKYLILSRLASKIADAAFGEEELKPGTYEIGNFQVQVKPTGTDIQVILVDTTTGNQTTVEVPMYNK